MPTFLQQWGAAFTIAGTVLTASFVLYQRRLMREKESREHDERVAAQAKDKANIQWQLNDLTKVSEDHEVRLGSLETRIK